MLQDPITDAMPIIANPVILGGVCYGCTVARTTITVDPSTVSRWSQLVSAVREPDPTPQSAAAMLMTAHTAAHTMSSTTFSAAPHSETSVRFLPTTQGLGISPTAPLPLSLDFPMGPSNFKPSDPSDLFSIPPPGFFASGAATRLYESDAQSLPFSPFATLGSTSSTFIPPSNQGIFDPYHARSDFTTPAAAAQSSNSNLPSTSQKRAFPPVPAQDEGRKRQKLEMHDNHPVGQQVGAPQVDHRSVAITNSVQATEVNTSNRHLSTCLPGANQGPTNATTPPILVPSFDCPHGMSCDDYIKLLHAKIAAESDATR
jgi:hypothetical protein